MPSPNLSHGRGRGTAGKVFLVGGGPGDPGLLTVRAQKLLRQADVVIYDYLIDELLLAEAPRAELIPARDLHGNRAEQERINELLIEQALAGKQVVRLKAGDPYLFGRGGEEGEALHDAGIDFEVTPGITSALGVPAYAGIPLTHREHSSSVSILTGHEQPGKEPSPIDWRQLAAGSGTLVFLMAMKTLPAIVRQLIDHGRAPSTPAAAIRMGTRPEQQTVLAPLAELPARVADARLHAPAVVVVGEVVKLRQKLDWFERLPLFGLGVLVTRTREQSGGFAESLREAGADVHQLPVIRIQPLEFEIPPAGAHDWVVFTSANGVRQFCDNLWASGADARWFGQARLCAIGPETARALTDYGLRADVVPETYVAEAAAEALAACEARGVPSPSLSRGGGRGMRVLIPRAEVAREALPLALREMGAQVDVLPVYRTELPEGVADKLKALLAGGRIRVVTFTSSSTVANFMKLAGELPPGLAVASIGPITSATARKHGLRVDVEAETYTTAGLKDALIRWARRGS